MSEHLFGLGMGHLSKRAERAAERGGATLVNYTEPRGEKRHWFAGPNRGEPDDSEMARRVMAAVRAAATKQDLRELDGPSNSRG